MTSVVVAGVGAMFGFGVWLVLAGFRGVRLLPEVDFDGGAAQARLQRLLIAIVVGAVIVLATGWLVAGVFVAIGITMFWGRLRGRGVAQSTEIGEAVAAWAEMVSSVLAAGGGLEQAIATSGRVAPAAIKDQARTLGLRVETAPLPQAIALFAADVAHPAADRIAAAIALSSQYGGADLGALLDSQVESTRVELRSALEVEASRARFRTSARMIVGLTGVMAVGLWFFAPDLMAFYRTFAGQVVLLVVGLVFLVGFWMLISLAEGHEPERFFTGRFVEVGSR